MGLGAVIILFHDEKLYYGHTCRLKESAWISTGFEKKVDTGIDCIQEHLEMNNSKMFLSL